MVLDAVFVRNNCRKLVAHVHCWKTTLPVKKKMYFIFFKKKLLSFPVDDSEASVSEAPPIDDATASEMAAVEAVSKNDHSSAAAGDASLYYAKFRALAPRVRPLTSEIERRAARRECLALLTDCHAAYFDERALLLGDVVARQLDELLAHADAKTVARSCCAYLLRVAELEWRLYRHFFARASPALARLLTDLSAPFCGTRAAALGGLSYTQHTRRSASTSHCHQRFGSTVRCCTHFEQRSDRGADRAARRCGRSVSPGGRSSVAGCAGDSNGLLRTQRTHSAIGTTGVSGATSRAL